MPEPEFIHGHAAAHEYLVERLHDLAPGWESFRVWVSPSWHSRTGWSRSPHGFPLARKVPGKRQTVFLVSELDDWVRRVIEAADPDSKTERARALQRLRGRTRAQSAAQAR